MNVSKQTQVFVKTNLNDIRALNALLVDSGKAILSKAARHHGIRLKQRVILLVAAAFSKDVESMAVHMHNMKSTLGVNVWYWLESYGWLAQAVNASGRTMDERELTLLFAIDSAKKI